jgi:hypothetical protein
MKASVLLALSSACIFVCLTPVMAGPDDDGGMERSRENCLANPNNIWITSQGACQTRAASNPLPNTDRGPYDAFGTVLSILGAIADDDSDSDSNDSDDDP